MPSFFFPFLFNIPFDRLQNYSTYALSSNLIKHYFLNKNLTDPKLSSECCINNNKLYETLFPDSEGIIKRYRKEEEEKK